MNCQEVRESLPALIDNELPPAGRAEVEKHLENCEECRAEKHRQEQFTTRVKTSLEDLKPSELFVKGVLDRLEDPKQKKQQELATVRRTKVSLAAAGGVIVLVLLAALAFILSTPAGPRNAATVTGYDKAELLIAGPNGEQRTQLPLNIPAGSRLRTDPGGKVLMRLAGGGQLELLEKSELAFGKLPTDQAVELRSGGVRLEATGTSPVEIAVGAVQVKADPGGTIQVSLQYGKTVAVHLLKGSGAISSGQPRREQRPEVGEVWLAPLDGSARPTRKPASDTGKVR
jgi:ferric-dicitrate binding protein FerR (iron transport regulator)